jgi:elongation factor 2
MVPFENVKYVSTPVVSVSIEPEYLRELDKMKELIENLLIEDPNLKFEINEENGEFLLSGMGPLHLEVTADEIDKRGVKVSVSEPRAVFKESCRNKSSKIKVNSPKGNNTLSASVERLSDKNIEFLQSIDLKNIKPLSHLKEILDENTDLSDDEINGYWNCDENQNLLIYQGNAKIEESIKNLIIEIISKIQLNGPLCGEKLTEIKFVIHELNISNLDEETAFTELSTMFYEAIKKTLTEADLVLLEPIYHTIIQLPPEHVKNSLSLLSKFSAKIKNIDQKKEYQSTIEILIPVRHSIKFAENIRSATSGRAFWQNEFYAFKEVPIHESEELISNLKFNKGLSW